MRKAGLFLILCLFGIFAIGLGLNSHWLIPRPEKINVWEIFDDSQRIPDRFLEPWLAAFDKPRFELELEKHIGKNQKIFVNFFASSYIDNERKWHQNQACWYCYKFSNKGQATIWVKAGLLYELSGKIFEIEAGRSVYVIIKTGLPPKHTFDESQTKILKKVKLLGVPLGYYEMASINSGFIVPKLK